MKHTFILQPAPHPARNRCLDEVRKAPDGFSVTIGPSTRTLDQNAAQWPILTAFSRQLQWPVNGEMTWLTPEEWKDLLSSAFGQQQPRVSPGLSGGMVLLGQRTRTFSKREFSDWLDFLNATAIERGVVLDEIAQ